MNKVLIFDVLGAGVNSDFYKKALGISVVELEKTPAFSDIKFLCATFADKRSGKLDERLEEKPLLCVLCLDDPRLNQTRIGPMEQKFIETYFELIRYIKTKSPQTKIIVADKPMYLQKYMEIGCDFYIYSTTSEHALLVNVLRHYIDQDQKWIDAQKSAISRTQFYRFAGVTLKSRELLTSDRVAEINFLCALIRSEKAKYVLDGGCGYGRIAIPLAQQVSPTIITGVDVNASFIGEADNIKSAQHIANVFFKTVNLLDTRMPSQQFNVTYLLWHTVCEFTTPELQVQLFVEMYRLLKSGGLLVFDIPYLGSNHEISEDGLYITQVNGFLKYIGLVPGLQALFTALCAAGFSGKSIEYKRVKWGIDKFVIMVRK